ncbi:MAG: zinc ribbon domain-containing protein [Clostridia bacterium]|nr:zinc ribbon domain-containing protein [Clostridia bacterium]
MICPFCHTTIEDGKRFCTECGKYIPKDARENEPEASAETEAVTPETEENAEPSEAPADEPVLTEAPAQEEPAEEATAEAEAAAEEPEPVPETAAELPEPEADADCTAVAEPQPDMMLPVPPDPKPAKNSQWATIGTWGWLGIRLLMFVPVLNLVLLIVWSFGGAKKTVKQSWARATLVLVLVGTILMLGFLLYILVSPERSARFLAVFGR